MPLQEGGKQDKCYIYNENDDPKFWMPLIALCSNALIQILSLLSFTHRKGKTDLRKGHLWVLLSINVRYLYSQNLFDYQPRWVLG